MVSKNYKFAAITHARKEPLFLKLWAQYYGGLLGIDNIYCVKDGDDWEFAKDTPIKNIETTRFRDDRQSCDQDAADYLSARVAKLLQSYDVVIRTDVDEFLSVDPDRGSWDDVAQQVQEHGYVYSLGLDVMHNPAVEARLDLSRNVLAQRSFANVVGGYCKPHVVGRAMTWTAACHDIVDGQVYLSPCLLMFHLASMDSAMLEQRFHDRGDFDDASYRGHAKRRFTEMERIMSRPTVPFEEFQDDMRHDLAFDLDGQRKSRARVGRILNKRSVLVSLPSRFGKQIDISDKTEPSERRSSPPILVPSTQGSAVERLHFLRDVLRPDRRTTIVDVGASPIEVPSYAFLLEQGACDVWGFEPQPDQFAKLDAEKTGFARYLPYAVGDGSTQSLNVTKHPGFTSILKPNLQTTKALNRWQWDVRIVEQIPLETKALDDMPDLPPFDLLKIDIQGGEANAISNGRRVLSKAVAVISEVAAIPIYENQPLLDDQMRVLRGMGFDLHRFEMFRTVPFRNPLLKKSDWPQTKEQLTDGDAIFVRSVLDLAALDDEQLKHLCLLSDFVFQSFSLALQCLWTLVQRGVVAEQVGLRYSDLISDCIKRGNPPAN